MGRKHRANSYKGDISDAALDLASFSYQLWCLGENHETLFRSTVWNLAEFWNLAVECFLSRTFSSCKCLWKIKIKNRCIFLKFNFIPVVLVKDKGSFIKENLNTSSKVFFFGIYENNPFILSPDYQSNPIKTRRPWFETEHRRNDCKLTLKFKGEMAKHIYYIWQ